MGTHPIFESDFDCLTEKMNRNIYEFTDKFRGAIFYQWCCDLHTEEACKHTPGDPGYCPPGCTYAMVNEHTKIKYPVLKDDGIVEVCNCQDEDICTHFVPRDDYAKLEEGRIIYAMWPFDDCHFYKARICRLQYVERFPERDVTDKITVANKTLKRKRKLGKNPEPVPEFGASPMDNSRYFAFNKAHLEVKINRTSTNARRTKELLDNIPKDQELEVKTEMARLNEEYKLLKMHLKKKGAM